jgi:hypothetical protein
MISEGIASIMRKSFLIIGMLVIHYIAVATDYSSNASGNWNNSSTWSPTGVPGASDNVIITVGNTVTLTADAACTNLSIGAWGSEVLALGAYNLSVSGNISRTGGMSITASTGYVILNGTSQTITVNGGITIPNLRLTNSTTISMGTQSDLTITGNFDCQTGSSTFTDNTLAWNSGKLYVTGTCTAPNCIFTITNDHVSPGIDFSSSTSNPIQVGTVILNPTGSIVTFGNKNVNTTTAFSGTNVGNITATGTVTVTGGGATPPTLTAASNPTVDANFNLTFSDNSTWRAAITSVKYGSTTLTVTTDYTIGSGTLTLKPSGSSNSGLRTAGTQTVTIIATGYSNATVSQAILAGAATKLGISTQPGCTTNPATLSTQPVVYIQDQYGNTTTSTATVTAAVGAGTWTIGGTTGIAGVSGTSTFTNLSVTAASSVTGATITFTCGALTSVTSATFNIPAPVFTTFYSQNATDLSSLNSWWSSTDGTGSHPSNFTTSGNTFIVQAGHSCSSSANIAFTNTTLTVNGTFTPVAAAVISGGTLNGSGTIQVTRVGASSSSDDFGSQYTLSSQTLTNLIVEYIGATGTQYIYSPHSYGTVKASNSVTHSNNSSCWTSYINNLIVVSGKTFTVDYCVNIRSSITNNGTIAGANDLYLKDGAGTYTIDGNGNYSNIKLEHSNGTYTISGNNTITTLNWAADGNLILNCGTTTTVTTVSNYWSGRNITGPTTVGQYARFVNTNTFTMHSGFGSSNSYIAVGGPYSGTPGTNVTSQNSSQVAQCVVATPDIALSSSNPAVIASNVAKSSLKNPIYKFTTAITTASATINSVAFITTNTAAADITKYQLWFKTSDDLSTAIQIGTDITTSLGSGTHTFTGLTQVINSGTTGYFWITVDVASGATISNTLSVSSAITTSNLTFASGNKTGTAYIGGTQTISAAASLSVSTATLSNFTYVVGSGPSAYQSFNLSGSNLTNAPGNITVTAPTDYVVCNTSGGTYGSTTTIAYTSSTLSATPVYVRLKSGLSAANYNSENVTFTGGGSSGATVVACSGTVGQIYYYIGGNPSNWSSANNWSTSCGGGTCSCTPTLNDSIVIGCGAEWYNSTNSRWLVIDQNVTVKGFTILNAMQVSISGTNTLTVNGGLQIGNLSSWNIPAQGLLNVASGNLNISGDLSLGYNNDTHGLRWDDGTITVSGNLICSDLGNLDTDQSDGTNKSYKPGGDSNSNPLPSPVPTYAGYLIMNGTNKTIQVNYTIDIKNLRISSNSISKTGSATLIVSGNLDIPNASTPFTCSTGIVELNSTITNASNLSIVVSGGTFKYSSTTASPTVSGISLAGGSTFVLGGSSTTTLNVSGNVDVTNGTFTIGSAAYSKTLAITGNLTIGVSGTMNVGAYNATHTLSCTLFSNSGTFDMYRAASQVCNSTITPSADMSLGGILDFNDLTFANVGSTKTITLASDFTVNGALSIGTNNGMLFGNSARTISVIGNLSGTGIINMSSSTHTLNLGGTTNTISTFTTDASASTVNYNKSGDQSVFTSANYRNLTISGSGTKTLSGTITVNNDLTISAGTLDASSGNNYAINLKGNVTNNGAYTARSGVFTLNGTSDQTISGSNSIAFYDLTINKASNKVILSKNTSSTHTLTLTSGNIDVGVYTFTATAISGGSSSSYIATTTAYNASPAGYLKLLSLNGAEKTLPVGTATTYNPCYITNSGTAQDFSVRVFTGVYANGLSGSIAADLAKLVNRTWEITPTVQTGISAIIKLQWNLSDEGATFSSSRSTAGLSKNRHIGGDNNWHVQASSAVTGSEPFTISNTTGITTFSTFGVGIEGSTLPIELTTFKAVKKSELVIISWETASETNNDYFTLEKSMDGENWNTIFTCDGAGTSTKTHNYSFPDEEPFSGLNYYRLKQTDINGDFAYSKIETVEMKNDSVSFISYPNPAYLEELIVIVKGICVETASITIEDLSGRQMCSGLVEISKSPIKVKLSDLCNLQAGTYFITIKGKNIVQNKRIVIK